MQKILRDQFKAVIVGTERKGFMNAAGLGETLNIRERKGISNFLFKVLDL